jgi:hypothetical protein
MSCAQGPKPASSSGSGRISTPTSRILHLSSNSRFEALSLGGGRGLAGRIWRGAAGGFCGRLRTLCGAAPVLCRGVCACPFAAGLDCVTGCWPSASLGCGRSTPTTAAAITIPSLGVRSALGPGPGPGTGPGPGPAIGGALGRCSISSARGLSLGGREMVREPRQTSPSESSPSGSVMVASAGAGSDCCRCAVETCGVDGVAGTAKVLGPDWRAGVIRGLGGT